MNGRDVSYMVWDESAQVSESHPHTGEKKKRPRPKRCSICHEAVESDGYGELIHSYTFLYSGYDERGNFTHVATM